MSGPLFIVFEGPDGGGKSTQANLLASALRARGIEVTQTREPGGTEVGEHIRRIILDPDSPPATALTTALLLSASRSELVSEVIRPSLLQGRTVISDRYAASTIAYQGHGLGLDLETAAQLAAIATGRLSPDVVLYIDVPPSLGLTRTDARGHKDKLDSLTLAFHTRVRKGYREMARLQPDRWLTIDGTGTPESVHHSVVESLEPFISGVTAAI